MTPTTTPKKPTLLNREPALWVAALEAVLLLAMAFGLNLTAEQLAYTMAAAIAVLALVTRQAVTPNVSVVERRDNNRVVAGAANDMVKPGETVRLTTRSAYRAQQADG